MRLGDVSNQGARVYGKPLDGVRVLSLEQMQALPYATQLLARLGAEVVKVEHPTHGESGRGSQPAMTAPDGAQVGATFLRNNLGKRSLGLDLKSERGRELLMDLVPRFDVVAENFKSGTMQRLGLGYEELERINPRVIYLSVSGFGNTIPTPYAGWPAYASIVEGMSGIYEYKRHPGERPRANPVGALGDISSALFGVIGILAALRHRDATGKGQYVDIAMLDAVVSMTDIVTNFWSLGLEREPDPPPMILDTFRARDGWFVMQLVRDHQFERLAQVIGVPEWIGDPRFATRTGWGEHLEDVVRPAIERWAATLTKTEAAQQLMEAGVACGPCLEPAEIAAEKLVFDRDMLVEMERTDGVAQPVLIPGNPVKMSRVAQGPETRVPWVGEHTDEVLRVELGLADDELAGLRAAGIVT